MTKSQEYLTEQAEVAQLLRECIQHDLGAPAMADRILRSRWLRSDRARAWAEGFDAGERDVWDHERSRDYDRPCVTNPYKSAADVTPEERLLRDIFEGPGAA